MSKAQKRVLYSHQKADQYILAERMAMLHIAEEGIFLPWKMWVIQAGGQKKTSG